MRKTTTFKPGDRDRVQAALAHLVDARNLLREAGCPKTLERVRAAISSCKGAGRNVGYREMRAYYAARETEERADRECIVYADGTVRQANDGNAR